MSQLIPDPSANASMWGAIEQSRSMRQAALATVTPAGAANLAALSRAYPGVPVGTKVSLNAAGVSPTDPIMATVAQASQQVKAKRGFGWHSIGDLVSAGTHALIGKPLEALGSVAAPVGHAIGMAAKPVVRGGLMTLAAPFEEAGGVLRDVASGLPGKLGETAAGALGGAALGAGLSGALGVAGAVVGSVVPGAGTAIGGALGAGAGAAIGGAVGGLAGLVGPDVKGTPTLGPQSSLGLAATHLLHGEKVQAGSGWFPSASSPLGQEQTAQATKTAGIVDSAGKVTQGWTVGRSIANTVAEPGTTPYNLLSGLVDATAAMKLDPAAHFLHGVEFDGELRALKSDGLIDGARKTILPEKVNDLLHHSTFGAALKDTVAGESSPYRIGKLFNGALDHDPAALSALADASTPEEAAQILEPLLGARVAEVPKLQLKRGVVSRLIPGAPEDASLTRRMAVDLPRGQVRWDDPADAIKKIDAWQAIGKVPESERLANNDKFIRSLAGPNTGRLPALEAVADSISSSAKAHGAPDAVARKLGTLFGSSINDARLYTAGTIADGELLPGMVVNGDGMGLKSPFMTAEFLNHGVYLPDPRELSDTVSKLSRVWEHPLTGNVTGLADKLLLRWKQVSIARPASALRVVGEEQARMTTAGYDSPLNHPIRWVARMVADKKGNVIPALTGEPLFDTEVIQGGLNRSKGSQLLQSPGVSMADRARLSLADGEDLFKGGWQDHELMRLHTDPIGRRLGRLRSTGLSAAASDEIPEVAAHLGDDAVKTAVADARGAEPGYDSIDGLKASFWDGPLKNLRKDLQGMAPGAEETVLGSREASDAYIDQINGWIDQFTGNHPDLVDFVHRGPNQVGKDVTGAAMDELIARDAHPPLVVGSRTLREGGAVKAGMDKAFDTIMDTVHTRPTNYFSRSKVLGQDYWNNVERMLPALNDADKATALKIARQAKLDPERIARLEARAAVPFDGPALTFDDVHDVAAHQAVDNTKKLLYDVSTKSKWADATRFIFPFAEPWKEALTIWGGLLKENPAAIRRLDQTVQGARGSGFFHKDPQTGEEMFTYPGSAFISKLVTGAPVPLQGTAAGLNLFASNPVMPGMGPLMQIAANKLLPDKPQYDFIRSVMSPYGRTDTSGGFVESFLPAWAQKLRQFATSGESDRLFNNTVYDMARYLVSSGQQSIDTPEAQQATTDAAISMAKRMYLLRAGASFVSPSAPMPQMVAEDKDGRVVTQFKLMDEYRKLQKPPSEGGVGYEAATQTFLDTYGQDALLLLQPKTKGGASPLDDTMDWIRNNPGLAKRYGDVYQYFAPHAGTFSQTAYERELATGERKPLTPQEAYEAANSRVASMMMRQARSKVGAKTSDGERKWLADVQAGLIDQYPGYNPQSFDAGKIPAAIRQLTEAMGNKKMASTPAGEAIGLYLSARDKAQQTAEAQGLTGFSKAKAAEPIRDWLRTVADAITAEHPEFTTVWDQLLSHELASDVPATTT